MSLQKLPDGMRIDLKVYLTNGQMSAAILLGNFPAIPPIDLTKEVDVANLLSAVGAGEDLAGWRVMTAAEIKEYREEEA